MEFQEAMLRRYSCRKYMDKPVPRELLTSCVEAGRRSPSGCNLQPWRFVVVDQPAERMAVAEAVYDAETNINSFSREIPAFIVMVHTPNPRITELQTHIIGACDIPVHLVDMGCAAMQICLAASDLGLGSLIMGKVSQPALKKALGIPEQYGVPLIIGLGYPVQEQVRPRPRRPLEDMLNWNRFEEETNNEA